MDNSNFIMGKPILDLEKNYLISLIQKIVSLFHQEQMHY